MEANDLTIHPTIGYGNIRLGITRDAARLQLGEPDEVETVSYPDDSSTEKWSYSRLGCTLDFSSDDDWLLGGIDVEHEEATLLGHRVIGMQEPVFLTALEKSGLTDVVLEDETEWLDSRCYESEGRSLLLWVHCGSLDSVTIGPRYDAAGENPQWPATTS